MKQAFKHTASFASCQIIRAINSDLLVRNHMKCMAASDQFSFNIGYPDHRITGNNCTKSIRCYQVEPHSLQTKLDYHQYMKNHRDNGSYKVKLIQKTTITAWSQNFIFQMYKAILMAGGVVAWWVSISFCQQSTCFPFLSLKMSDICWKHKLSILVMHVNNQTIVSVRKESWVDMSTESFANARGVEWGGMKARHNFGVQCTQTRFFYCTTPDLLLTWNAIVNRQEHFTLFSTNAAK